ncbi:MAG TPA: electron transfer flavoprotein subunit beta/FixA family protein, partial [Thermoplasmata archaeon]|nr:electron transfer flavoprotein subunit beta/FixA family protein [Thermoplasmata archaeon]
MTNIAVLLKVVPDLEGIRYDPERKTLIRQGVNLFLNPFDGRALRVALDLRRSGDSVTAISMGPPAAERVLREALDLGADRALLITDRLLAGSDTLVTARTLIRSIQLAAAELILCGRNSTDSDTGQVGPQVAGMLGIPFLSSARRIDRMDGEPNLEVVSDTEAGWARYRCTPPAVVSVDEKIAKIRKPTPEELAAASPRKVEILTATQLGLDASVLGLAGSPTVVGELVNEEPGRNPQLFIEGTPEERVQAAATALGERLSRGPPTPPPAPPLVEPLNDAREVLVHVTDEEGELQAAALPILTGVRRLGRGFWPSAIWVGPPPSESALQAIAAAGGRVVRHLGNTPGPMLPRRVAIGITAALESRPAAAGVAFLATLYGRSVAGQVSARADLGLV